jgi:hypothetical protein
MVEALERNELTPTQKKELNILLLVEYVKVKK